MAHESAAFLNNYRATDVSQWVYDVSTHSDSHPTGTPMNSQQSALSQSRLSESLAPRPIRYFEAIGSTNDEAMDWLMKGAETGSLVIANQQTSGRGRLGRKWITPPGAALALSIILHPPVVYMHRLVWVGALAVADVCDTVLAHVVPAPHIGVKYPNDVQIDQRKISGILTEAAWKETTLLGVVLGIGVNLNVEFPPELQATATNLSAFTPDVPSALDLYQQLVARITYWNDRLGSDELFNAWKSRLSTLGQRVKVNDLVGIATDVTQDGYLLLQTDDGTIHRIIVGDVLLP
jgi:BirA family transcriptional regulator, biotin operon repressor / biotin---[acetyl-CoA-carboxylase] ligase